jgi:hypothetical protein
MSPTPMSRRRRWRRTALAAAGVSLIATISPLVSASPAGAVNAPLFTEDGVGIRLDENAILGPALEEIETSLQPFVNQMIYNGAIANSPAGTPKSTHVTSNLELGFDFVNAGTAGYPQGGLKVHADILGIEIRYIKDPVWPFADCSIWVRPDTATIDASAYIDTSKLPGAPVTINPISAYWDDDPSVDYSGVCWWWLIDDFFDNLFSSGGSNSIADNIETELNSQAQQLVDDLWADYVVPVVDSLAAFGITFDTIKTDDHGLIVTADVDASAGITLPGDTVARNVTNAQDSGATSDVNTLLANRASDAIVSIHPNVANQFLYAFRLKTGSIFGTPSVSSSIESALLNPAVHGNYADNGWTVSMTMATGTTAPYTQPTGSGGAPQARIDDAIVIVRNTSTGSAPVAAFRGSITGMDLLTATRPDGTWGPTYGSSNVGISMTRINGNADVVAFNASPSVMLPYVKNAVDHFDDNILTPFVSLAPIAIGNLDIGLCTGCGRYSGDQRYTETFTVS